MLSKQTTAGGCPPWAAWGRWWKMAVIVEMNVNADLAADMQVKVNLQTNMQAGDFIV